MDRQTINHLLKDRPLSLEYKPQIFNLHNPQELEGFTTLLKKNIVQEVIDNLSESIEDLFRIDFPYIAPQSPEYIDTYQEYYQNYLHAEELFKKGIWAFYPWKRTLVHLPEEEDFHKLRTARNKFLITEEEQAMFYGAHIGIAGLSVGSSVVNSITLSGGGGSIRIADGDSLAITNLNRLHSSVCDLDRNKAIISARKIYEVNPYQHLEVFSEGLLPSNLDQFFTYPKPLDLFIEEMDTIKLKIDTRFKARKLRIPVVMVTDNGDNAILDVERFDLEPNRPLFHGLVPEKILKNIPEKPTTSERIRLASAIVGNNITPRTQLSLTQVGTKLPSWPQLGNAATLSGVVASYVARRILCKQEMPSGRYQVNLDAILDPEYHSPKARRNRKKKTEEFINGFNLLYG